MLNAPTWSCFITEFLDVKSTMGSWHCGKMLGGSKALGTQSMVLCSMSMTRASERRKISKTEDHTKVQAAAYH